jgi:hypothetical protein
MTQQPQPNKVNLRDFTIDEALRMGSVSNEAINLNWKQAVYVTLGNNQQRLDTLEKDLEEAKAEIKLLRKQLDEKR